MTRELPRKIIHACTLLVPLAASRWFDATRLVIAGAAVFFAFSEIMKVRGKRLWIHRFILPLERENEKPGIAKAPLLLSVGVLLVVSFCSWPASFVAIWQTGFSDVMAAVVGRRFPIRPLFYNPQKSWGGFAAFFVGSLPVALMFCAWPYALLLSLAGAVFESLPFRDWDNFTVPVGTGILAQVLFLTLHF